MLTASNPTLRIFEASSALEGLDIARSQRPDLVLLDLLMPGMSGYDFLGELRRDETFNRTSAIVMSARDIEDEVPPIVGELRLSRDSGFTLSQLSQGIQSLLGVATSPGLVARDGAPTPRADRPVAPAW